MLIDRKLEDWKRRLLDLTRRNPALYFHPEKAFNLQVEAPDASALLSRLLVEEKKRHVFIPAPVVENDVGEESDSSIDEGDDAEYDARPGPDDLVFKSSDGRVLRRRLKSLFRAAHADFEERALTTLHFACGLLNWSEGGSERCTTPLLMIPVTLARDPEKDTYSVGPAEDEPILNPSLTAKLADAFGLTLPDIPEEWDGDQYSAWIASVQEAVRAYKWDVLDSQWFARFSFHKLSLYQDLVANKDVIKEHSIVKAIAGDAVTSESSSDLPQERDLDRVVIPSESFTVLDADSSQLVCIEAVRRGKNVIVQGPPGTGKSQTIVNLIAQLIGAGKSVLFVSEKIAALEVVYARLRDVGLGGLCLELHSHKANKREVVNELQKSLNPLIPATRAGEASDLERLSSRRAALNRYAGAIGSNYGSMPAPLFHYLGELSTLHDMPYIAFRGDVAGVDTTKVNAILDTIRDLQHVWIVAQEGSSHPWFGLGVDGGMLTFKSDVDDSIKAIVLAATQLQDETQRICGSLDLPAPTTLEATAAVHRLANVIDLAPEIRPEWLNVEGNVLSKKALEWKRIFEDHLKERGWLRETAVEQAILIREFNSASWTQQCSNLKALLGTDESTDALLSAIPHHIEWLGNVAAAIVSETACATSLAADLGVEFKDTLTATLILVRAVDATATDVRPLLGWFAFEQYTALRNDLLPLRDDVIATATTRREILETYEVGVFDLDLDKLIEDFAGEFRSLLRWLNPKYRRAAASIRSIRKDGKLPKNILGDLRRVRDCLHKEKEVSIKFAPAISFLGERYKREATDFASVDRCLDVVSDVRELLSDVPQRLAKLLAGQESPLRARALASDARQASERLGALYGEQNALNVNGHLASFMSDVWTAPLNSIAPVIEALTRSITECQTYLVSAFGKIPNNTSMTRVLEIARHVEKYRELEVALLEAKMGVASDLGNEFVGDGTPAWAAIERVAEWLTHKAVVLQHRDNETVLNRLRNAGGSAPLTSRLDLREQTFKHAIDRLSARFLDGGAESLRHLRSGSLDEIAAVCDVLASNLDRIQEWRDYAMIKERVRMDGFGELFDALVAMPHLESALLVDVARKSILQAYVDLYMHSTPELREFRGEAHSALVDEFKRLDKSAIADNARRVVSLSMQRRPKELVAYPGSEARVLLTEAGRKRGHLPIRKLFARMPSLLQQLKPCLLMSPLSVSQFLDPNGLRFNCVIFDEASQICSEDAVSAIYRGNQLVVCGDKMQLPPTNFFKQGEADDEVEADEDVAVFESILAEAETAGFVPKQLTWHYRSAHESLIAFSNERYYNNSLITFPSAASREGKTAVEFIHVPDGVYDRGGRRNNVVEAERVAGLVVEHIEKWPERSLGVVAFSSTQADAIQNRIEVLQKERRDLAWFFADERLNGFFVKNLERVQGDERDHIMFSIGYGKDKNGSITMNFGPVGKPGGEKRLNVAVTRARQQVTVVSSIRAADIDVDRVSSAGTLGLHKYLDFAERGYVALDQHGVQRDYESPFEVDVAGAIRSLGYSVYPQIGVSSFRIDLGVVDPAEPGRFILGVECDGATYHSSYTARDRDRLRHEILVKKMGWRLHHIWSPDWVQKRGVEIDRLKTAIDDARVVVSRASRSDVGFAPSHAREVQDAERPREAMVDIPVASVGIVDPLDTSARSWTEPYVVATISREPLGFCEFHEFQATRCLTDMALEVIAIEGPVHRSVVTNRLAARWNLSRVGNRMVEAMDVVYAALGRGGKFADLGNGFGALRDASPLTKVRTPVAGSAETLRSIEHVSADEISLCVKFLLQEAVSFEEDQLIVQLARVFGYNRTGNAIRNRLVSMITRMENAKQILKEGNRIFLGP